MPALELFFRFVSFDVFDEIVEQKLGISRPARCFGVKLSRKDWLGFVLDTFVGIIVDIFVQWFPIAAKGVAVDSKTMVLAGDVTGCITDLYNRVIMSAVAIF